MAWAGSGLFTATFDNVLTGTAYNLETDAVRVALYNNAVTPDYDAALASVAYDTGTWVLANERSGTGWAAGGVLLASKAVTPATPAAGQLQFDAEDVIETGTTLTDIYGCLIYDDTVANNGIVAVQFSGAPYSTSAGTLTISWHANGIFYIDLVP